MSGTSILPGIPAYLSVSANEPARIVQFEKNDPQTKSDIAYLTKQAPKLTSVDALLKDYRSLSIVLSAFGMEANIGQTALLRQLMTQNPTAKLSTATKIGNPVYTRFALAMNQFNPSPFATKANVTALATALGTNNYEASQDTQSPGIADALYFKRTIGSVTSLQQLMSDPKLLQVATVATNMPTQFGTLDYNMQVKLLSAQINMTHFQKPSFVGQFIQKYLAMNAANNSTVADPSGALSILSSGGSASNILGSLVPRTSSSNATNMLSLFA